jgi:hypothetical protein
MRSEVSCAVPLDGFGATFVAAAIFQRASHALLAIKPPLSKLMTTAAEARCGSHRPVRVHGPGCRHEACHMAITSIILSTDTLTRTATRRLNP